MPIAARVAIYMVWGAFGVALYLVNLGGYPLYTKGEYADGRKAPQQGIHLTGSFPSNAAGTMVTTSGSATSWTGRAEAGGQSAPNTETTAFAVCAAAP